MRSAAPMASWLMLHTQPLPPRVLPDPSWTTRHRTSNPPDPRGRHARMCMGHDPIWNWPHATCQKPLAIRPLHSPTLVRRRLCPPRPGIPHHEAIPPPVPPWPKHGLLPRAGEMLGHLPSLLQSACTPSLQRCLPACELLPRTEVHRRLCWIACPLR
ncbi:hypothetical protein ACHAW6_002960 [Cyclotella cf. meneghiniana]